MVKSFAELKRKLKVGDKLRLARHDWAGRKLQVGDVREISRVQSNGIALRTGESESWLYWGKAADYRFDATGFEVALIPGSFSQLIRYEFAS